LHYTSKILELVKHIQAYTNHNDFGLDSGSNSVVRIDLENTNFKDELETKMANYKLDIWSVHWSDEDVKANANKLFRCQKDVLVVS